MDTQTITVTGLSNREFIERYAAPGRLGLCGGTTKVDLAIRVAQRHLTHNKNFSHWSHAFLFAGRRIDGQHWVMESDLQILTKNVQLGVQENRADKYFDEKMYPALAILDFGLNETQTANLLREGLELVATRERYSLRELIGTLAVLKKPELRARENRLAQERSVYCSAFVKRLFHQIGIDLVPGVAGKNTAPEDLAHSPLPHTQYLLVREMPDLAVRTFGRKIQAGVKEQLTKNQATLKKLRQRLAPRTSK
ncbi:MAG TPA: hypothetical protein VF607_07600 [Verrucomicrobiae bacterium]